MALANTVYPSVGLRHFDDLDLLVQPDSADAALVVLRQLGYILIHAPKAVTGITASRTPIRSAARLLRFTQMSFAVFVQVGIRPNCGSVRLHYPCKAKTSAYWHAKTLSSMRRYMRATHASAASMRLPTRHCSSKSGIDKAMLISLSQDAGAANALDFLLRTAAALQLMPELPTVPTSRFQQRITGSIADWNTLTPHPASHQIGPIPKLIELLLVDSWRDSASLLRVLLMPPQPFMRNAPQYGSMANATISDGSSCAGI